MRDSTKKQNKLQRDTFIGAFFYCNKTLKGGDEVVIVRVREDSVDIEGYVNAIERKSKPLMSRIGKFVERICKGAFKKAINRNDNIRLLLNHNWERDLGGTKDGNLILTEDNIGLHARATINDQEAVEKARNGSKTVK